MRITKTTTIGELLDTAPEIADVLTEMGLHCLGCPSSRNESVAQAAEVHGFDPDEFLDDLKGFMETMF